MTTAFRETPASVGLQNREYPPNEPPAAKAARERLRDAVLERANAVMEDAVVAPMVADIENNERVVRYRRWATILRRLEAFEPMEVYRRVLPDGTTQPVNSGDRMTGALMNPYPTTQAYRERFTELFRENPKRALFALITRAIHRHVNDAVFKTFDLRSTVNTDPDVVSRGGNVLTKREMSLQFLHNSQRAYWNPRVSNWGVDVALPAAYNAVLVALRDI